MAVPLQAASLATAEEEACGGEGLTHGLQLRPTWDLGSGLTAGIVSACESLQCTRRKGL